MGTARTGQVRSPRADFGESLTRAQMDPGWSQGEGDLAVGLAQAKVSCLGHGMGRPSQRVEDLLPGALDTTLT